ncbi:MAG: urea carboxylase-associated family protein [Chloroflexota bacterium]|nr:urea carboxylase-associated family protein [Chloroflexota bacterium]
MPVPETIHIPAREGRGVSVRAGDRVRVIDPEGGQVADVFAFSTDDPSEYHSAEHTRVYVDRLFPQVGEQFVTNRRRPILTLEADDSPGIHDMLCAACDPTRYQGLGVDGWHASCQENLLGAMRQLGVERVEVPQPINLFMNIPVGADAELGWLPAPTRPGNSTTLRAELDCCVVVSACPQDLIPINAGTPGPIDLEITRA